MQTFKDWFVVKNVKQPKNIKKTSRVCGSSNIESSTSFSLVLDDTSFHILMHQGNIDLFVHEPDVFIGFAGSIRDHLKPLVMQRTNHALDIYMCVLHL